MPLICNMHFVFLAFYLTEATYHVEAFSKRRLENSRYLGPPDNYASPGVQEKNLLCGDYYKLSASDVGYIVNPGYPDIAETRLFCIWLIEAPQNHRVNFSIMFQGDKFMNQCADFVQVRNNDRRGPVLGQFCDAKGDRNSVQSMGQWLWVMLQTDNYTDSPNRLYAEFYAFTDANSSMMSEKDHKKKGGRPFLSTELYMHGERECRSYEFECRNKECISLSYRCDNVNDCGCKVDCDENGCDGIHLDKQLQFLIGLSIGAFVFVSVCFITCLIEGQSNWIASRVEELRMRENQAEERRKKAFKAFTKFIGEKEV